MAFVERWNAVSLFAWEERGIRRRGVSILRVMMMRPRGGISRGGVSILRAVMMRPREASGAGREYFPGGDDEA